jgi:hypothetical protein
MSEKYNVYCDESCHLLHDQKDIMVLGAITCPEEKARETAVRLREIKEKHNLPPHFEVKWTKVSPGKVEFYRDIIDYFFDDDHLRFRAVVAQKVGLNHAAFDQNHDTWYYKMYFQLLEVLLSPHSRYRIYVDIKDTRSQRKVEKLHDVLCNSKYDFDRRIVERVQQVTSHEIEQIQLADLLIGSVSHANRIKSGSPAKQALITRIQHRSGYSLASSTLLGESKFNIFHWSPKGVVCE